MHYKKHLHIKYAGLGTVSILIRVYDLDGTVLAVVASKNSYGFIETCAEESGVTEGQVLLGIIEDLEKELTEYD